MTTAQLDKKLSNEYENYDVVMEYASSIINGKKIACKETIQMCEQFFRDLENTKDYDFKPNDAEFVISIIEETFVHKEGQDLQGYPLAGEPFLLEPWQKFVVYNLIGFYHKGTILRRFSECFMMLPRKTGKTPFSSSLAWALGLLERKSGSKVYIVAALLKQAKQSFDFINYNLENMGEAGNFRVRNNNQEHSIVGNLGDGSLHIEALAGQSDRMHSLVSNIQILDELHLYKSASQYNTIKDSGKAYRNKLTIGITTAGDNMNSFCYNRKKYCQQILEGTVTDEQYFVFIAKADTDEQGNVDYTNPIEHEKANPNYNVTISPQDILNDSMQAQNDPQQRKDFLSSSLNVYTSAMRAYFNLDEFKNSDKKYSWTLEELAKLPINWYGGADLSKMHDLTATSLYGHYEGIDIAITHAFFPITQAHNKAENDNIPIFGWQDDGVLTMSNSPTVSYNDVIKWFMDMRNKGFKVKQVGFDVKFGREFFSGMKQQRFNIVNEPQYFHHKSEGFRRIEKQAKDGKFYCLSNPAYEYCVTNVKAIEQTDDAMKYEKITDNARIDLFDASVFASVRMLNDMEQAKVANNWFG